MTSVYEATPDKNISALLAGRIDERDFASAAYLVAERGQVRFADVLGDAVREPARHAATLDTIYDLASLTKPLITGMLCALLLERGLIALDAAVASYLTEFARDDQRHITVRHLLTHTSGLPAWLPLYISTGGERRCVLEIIAGQNLEYETGARVVYSDLGFITLGLLIERVAGETLSALARLEIFEPLKLRRMFFNPPRALRPEIAASESNGNAYERETCVNEFNVSTNHRWRDALIWGEVHDGNAHFLGGAAGHAGLFSTASETLQLAMQFIADSTQLLKPETCALFRTNMTEHLNEARSFAWQLAATPLSTAGERLPPDSFGHLGFTGTSLWIDAGHARVFILLTNRTHARTLPFVNINSVRRRFHTLAVEALERQSIGA